MSRFIEHLDSEQPTLAELELTGCLSDPYKELRASIAAASKTGLGSSRSAPPTPALLSPPPKGEKWKWRRTSWLSNSSDQSSMPDAPKAVRRQSLRLQLKPSMSRASSSSPSPASPVPSQSSPSSASRPNWRRSTSYPSELDAPSRRRGFLWLPKKSAHKSSEASSDGLTDEEGVDIFTWRRDVRHSFEILSRPAAKSPTSAPEPIALPEIKESSEPPTARPSALQHRHRVLSTPSPRTPDALNASHPIKPALGRRSDSSPLPRRHSYDADARLAFSARSCRSCSGVEDRSDPFVASLPTDARPSPAWRLQPPSQRAPFAPLAAVCSYSSEFSPHTLSSTRSSITDPSEIFTDAEQGDPSYHATCPVRVVEL